MDSTLIATSKIIINSTTENLWEVLTKPEHIKVYLFGTEVNSDWKEGSPICFQGEYNGQQYKDKGNVIENKPNELLKYNYWSNFSGMEDNLENYSIVTYIINKISKNELEFTWHQQGFSSEEGKCHTAKGLQLMLEQIKKIAEV